MTIKHLQDFDEKSFPCYNCFVNVMCKNRVENYLSSCNHNELDSMGLIIIFYSVNVHTLKGCTLLEDHVRFLSKSGDYIQTETRSEWYCKLAEALNRIFNFMPKDYVWRV